MLNAERLVPSIPRFASVFCRNIGHIGLSLYTFAHWRKFAQERKNGFRFVKPKIVR